MVMTGAAPAEPDLSWPQSVAGFDALIEATQRRLVQFAFCRLHSLPDAEDVFKTSMFGPIAIGNAIATWTRWFHSCFAWWPTDRPTCCGNARDMLARAQPSLGAIWLAHPLPPNGRSGSNRCCAGFPRDRRR